ncbi:MAG: hypothetical protein K2X27_10380 [Candidatus Obscuribacterales bacterium]|nr:hypothetical protein [Candidatus Obscuribacterales bacterium]
MTELTSLKCSELVKASRNNENSISHCVEELWTEGKSLGRKAVEHPLESTLLTALAIGTAYYGVKRLRSPYSQSQVAALAEQSQVRLAAFRPQVLTPLPAAIAEIEAMPALHGAGFLETETVRKLSFSPGKVRGFGVGQATYAIAPTEIPLATRGLATCGGLVVQNEKTGLHYLAHLDCAVSPSQIRSSLSSFNLAESNIYLMRGPRNFMVDSCVVEALRTTPGALERLKFVQGVTDGRASCYGIGSYRGAIYGFSPRMNAWPLFQTGQPGARQLTLITGNAAVRSARAG